MKTSMKHVTTLAALLVAFAGAELTMTKPSFAAPLGIEAAKLAPQTRTELRASIHKARVFDPAAFKEVREIAAHAREADKRARGRKAPVALHLARLGTKALLPMIELVAFETAPLAANETPVERAAVQRDLVEAIGLLKDKRALPVLVAMLSRDSDFASTRTAAEAIARLDSDEAASTLVSSLGAAKGERASAILAGLGACHRAVIAHTLADRLGGKPDDATAKHVVKSLGQVGNAWAWKTLADRGDEPAARETAAKALVAAYVQYGGEVREAAAKALLVVDDAHTTTLVEAARRGAATDVALALDELAQRLASNPTR